MDTNLTNNLSNKIQYIGCDDATLDLFESQYPLPNGMCYNSYGYVGGRGDWGGLSVAMFSFFCAY